VYGLKVMQLSLLSRVTCAVTGCNITLPGFLQSARPPNSLSRTCRRPRIARF
jgi:hypothetical protein